jgi:small subunit ribosomal protein S19e
MDLNNNIAHLVRFCDPSQCSGVRIADERRGHTPVGSLPFFALETDTMTGVCVRDVDSQKFIAAYAAHLKRSGKLEVPAWTDMVKTAASKELAPYDPDWFYVRTAALARHVYLCPGAGVGALRTVYGQRKNRGVLPSKGALASGNIIRKALQALEKLKLVSIDANGGRRITSAGQRDLDGVAQLLSKSA